MTPTTRWRVTCPACGHVNEAANKFCAECGARLASACPACGTPNPPISKFCGECGAALVLSLGAAQPEATGRETPATTERRFVSILFADLVGFTALTAGRDPEEVRAAEDRYFAVARSIIERYGGTVEKFIGDAVMAVWGAPVAHEDDAERSIRAALELANEVGAMHFGDGGPSLVARAAVMSGEVAVAVGAAGQAMVSGELVNAASRLQGLAPTGGVFADDATRRAADDAIEFEDAGDQEIRGLAEPVHAWRPLHVVSMRRGAGRSNQLEPPFVGRDAELRLLKELLHGTSAERRARLVSVTGLAGIGKTRLAWELEKYIDGIVEDIWWHQGRSPAYGDGITFWALAEMVRARAGIAETDPPEAARARLAKMLTEHIDDDAERRRIAPAFAVLLGLEETTGQDPDQLFAAWRLLFERIARRGPVVLVFEDLQWADTGLIDFVESILEWSRNHPILVVTLARPELLERRPTWGARQRNFSALHLEPLGAEAMRALLAGLAPGLPRALERQIVDRAAGVPLFAVETVRMLLDEGHLVLDEHGVRVAGGLDRLAIPGSLRTLVGARLDALEPGDRALLQAASVLGQSFTIEGLAAVTAQDADQLVSRLSGLVRRELLEALTDPRSPERGQYTFVQAVIREVAYETLSKQDRRARHLDAARYFEGVGGDDVAGILASHYYDAYLATRTGPEADSLAAQAWVALRGAADRASALGSYDQALAYLAKALTVTSDTAERGAILEASSVAAYHSADYDRAEGLARQALERATSVRDEPGIARAAVLIAQPLEATARTAEALAILEAALAACVGEQETPAVVALESEIARILMVTNDPRALDAADRVLERAEPLDIVPTIVDALVTKAGALGYRGRTLEASALLRGSIELAASHGLTSTESRARSNLGNELTADDPRAALALAMESRDLAWSRGLRDGVRWVTWQGVAVALALGELDTALSLTADLEEADLAGSDVDSILGTRAVVAAYRGDAELAASLRAQEEAVFADVSRADFIAGRHYELALLKKLSGDLEAAFEAAVAGAAIFPYLVTPALALRLAVWMGDLERARRAAAYVAASIERGRWAGAVRRSVEAGLAALEGRTADAAAAYRAAATGLRSLDATLDLGLVQLDHATVIRPDDPDARAAAAEARAIFTRLDMPPLLARLEEVEAGWRSDGRSRVAAGKRVSERARV